MYLCASAIASKLALLSASEYICCINTDIMTRKGKIITWTAAIIAVALAIFIYFKFCFVFGEGVKAGELNQIGVNTSSSSTVRVHAASVLP